MVASTSSCVGSAATGKGVVVLAHLQIVEDEIWTTIFLLNQQKTVFWLGGWNNWPGTSINQRSGLMVKVAVIDWCLFFCSSGSKRWQAKYCTLGC